MDFKSRLRDFLEQRYFIFFITFLILYSAFSFSVLTLPSISSDWRNLLNYSEYFVVAIFTLEYIARIYSAERPLRFIFSFYGLIDLIAILPFYLAFALDLRSLRLIRLLRLFRLLKLARYNAAIQRFYKALYESKEELILFTCASFILIYIAAVGIYHFEHRAQPEVFKTLFDSLWWAVATLTTVGYGDTYPITIGGRIFTFLILMIGLGLVAVPTGIVASALTAAKPDQKEQEKN